jgi:hypothetical protein
MTTAVTTYTVGAILIVCLLVMAAMTIAVYRLIATQPNDGDDDPVTAAVVTGSVWDETVAHMGHPDDIDTTMAMPAWPGTEAAK